MAPGSNPTNCPTCDSPHLICIEQWRVGKRHMAWACNGCGLLFVHPFPTPEALEAFYAPGGRWSTVHGDDRVPKKRGAARALLASLDDYFPASRPAHGSSVLDFGCGSGAWLNELQDRGWVTYGIEPSTDLAFHRHARLLSIPTQAQFQFVIAYHVLEHLPRPLDTLHHLAQALCSGGHCFISVPRLDGLAAHGKMHYCLQKHNHIVAFTEACMRGLLARAGLETLTSLHCLDRPDVPPHRLRLLARKGPVSHPLPDARLALQQVTREIDLLLKAGGGQ